MNRNYFVIIAGAAVFCLFLIFVSLWQEIETPVTKDPITPPNIGPYTAQIFGSGIVEPNTGNILIGTPLNRIVRKVFVKVGEKVEKGQPLFSLENSDLKANVELQKIAFESALAKLQKLKLMPRKEDLAIAEAVLTSAKVALESAKNQNDMVMQLPDQRAVSQEEKDRRRFAYRQAQIQWDQAQSNYEKVRAGTWKPDLEIADLEALQAEANINLLNTEIERTVIKSPINGTILQIKIHDGELPSMDASTAPLMIIGNTDEMYLRVSINQMDIPLFRPEGKAIAYLQGNNKYEFPLEFVREEPLLVRKQNLTNDIHETVDTRVLQIIYRIKNEGRLIFVGQQMDVFMETERAS